MTTSEAWIRCITYLNACVRHTTYLIQVNDIAYTKRLMTMGANPNLTCCLDLWSSGRQVETETVEEAEMQSLLMNNVTNETCNPNVESTLPGLESDAGMDHKCETIRENRLPVSQLEWTALHTASARAQQHSVQALLEQDTDVNAKDVFCRTPLDVAGLAHYEGHKINEKNFMETIDLLLKAGGKFLKCCGKCYLNTPLHTAVELGSEAAVRQILQGGASVTAWNSVGLTAMHMCVEKRNEILLEMLASHKSSNKGSSLASIDVADHESCTVLCAAVKAKWLQGVRIALSAKATNIQATRGWSKTTVFHLAAERGITDVLEHLLDFYNQDEIEKIINTFDSEGPPIYYAVCNEHAECVRLLISKGAKVNILTGGESNTEGVALLELAVGIRNTKIAEMIIQSDNETVDAFGRSPLYIACGLRDKKTIALLLKNGADITVGKHDKKMVPLKMVMEYVSKPTEFMQEIFDSNLRSLSREDEDEVIVDFRVLLPKSCGTKKLKVIQLLLDTGNTYDQQRLLLHPLVQSFLYFQWKSSLPFFYIILALHVCFVLSLNVFALTLFWYQDNKIEPVPIVFRSSAWIYFIYLTAFLLTIQELIVIKKKLLGYLLSFETLVKWFSTMLAITLPIVVTLNLKSNPESVRLFASVTLLLTWVRMMYQLSRLPDWGYYVLMYGKVAIKVFKILASFSFLIFGFSVSFMIQFHAKPPFEDPLSALLTTMVMMSSELGYNEVINKQTVEETSASVIMKRLIFASFLIFVSIILMNLLVAVAVNDVNNLEIVGNINRLQKQVQFIKSFEDTADNNFIKKILPTYLYNRWFEDKTPCIFGIHRYFPRKRNHGLPTHLLEAIFENVRLQNRQSHEKQGEKLNETKLDEIHEVVVNKETCVSAEPDTAMNQVLEEIMKLRADVKKIKNRNGNISRCSRCRKHRKVF